MVVNSTAIAEAEEKRHHLLSSFTFLSYAFLNSSLFHLEAGASSRQMPLGAEKQR